MCDVVVCRDVAMLRRCGLLVAPFPDLKRGLVEADILAARAGDERILSLVCFLAERVLSHQGHLRRSFPRTWVLETTGPFAWSAWASKHGIDSVSVARRHLRPRDAQTGVASTIGWLFAPSAAYGSLRVAGREKGKSAGRPKQNVSFLGGCRATLEKLAMCAQRPLLFPRMVLQRMEGGASESPRCASREARERIGISLEKPPGSAKKA